MYQTVRRLNRIMLISTLTVALLSVGAAIAYMFAISAPMENTFERAVVSCEVAESFDEHSGVKDSIAVKNTSNIPVYVRIRIVSYRVDGEGNIIGIPSEIPHFTLADGWTETEYGTYEYEHPIGAGQSSPSLFADGSVMTLDTYDEESSQVVEVFAEAIQSEPARAREEAWR